MASGFLIGTSLSARLIEKESWRQGDKKKKTTTHGHVIC